MTSRAIMFMGTGSDVGKSLIVAGLARALNNRGLRVAPFKPQNMSNNAAVTSDGGEIGRAQALQARAARVDTTVHMNPILLKPESTTGAQVIVQGKRFGTMKAREFFSARSQFMPAIGESFARLCESNDIVLAEGAGSPAESNLRKGDLANFGFAQQFQVPAILVGDIHRGGVIASIVGTCAMLDSADNELLKAFLINKFHGDPKLFDEGLTDIISRTKLQNLGVIPHFEPARNLPAEDAVALEDIAEDRSKGFKVVVLRLPRIANFDDLDPLATEPNVSLSFLKPGDHIPGDTKLVIIPGSKSTISDLNALHQAGWDIDLKAHVRRGGHVLGLCGGYQMLGCKIADPNGIEGEAQSVSGLGLLDVETTLLPEKSVTQTTATHLGTGEIISAYEIHLGKTTGTDCTRPFAITPHGPDGAISRDGLVTGTYLHGCLSNDAFRSAYLKSCGGDSSKINYERLVEDTLDNLAAHLERHVNIDLILSLSAQPKFNT